MAISKNKACTTIKLAKLTASGSSAAVAIASQMTPSRTSNTVR